MDPARPSQDVASPAPTCGWCGDPSVTRIKIRGGKLPVWANVCEKHERHFAAQEVESERAETARRYGANRP